MNNLAAAAPLGYLGRAEGQTGTQMARLAAGRQITSAAQNPAGLAISEQMQSQIDGLGQAYQNAAQGVSMLQTADGAMSQIQNILQSMYSLATQAANGTNVGVDRGSIQSQMDQYTKEIDSITNQTSFNTKNLLDGVLGTVNLATGANPGQALRFSIAAMDARSLGVAGTTPDAAAFSAAQTATAARVGLGGLEVLGGASATAPYGSYGLTGGDYTVQLTAASLATADVNGQGPYGIGRLSGTTRTVGGEGTFSAGGTSGLAGSAGDLALSAVTYPGSAPVSVQVRLTASQTWGPSGQAGAQYLVQFSTDGGSAWQTAYTNGSATTVGAAPNALVTFAGLSGLGVNFAPGSSATSPTFPGIAGTSDTSGTATETALYTLQVEPAQSSWQLSHANGVPVGGPTTLYGRAAGTQAVVLGDPATGQALQVNYDATTLFAAPNAYNPTTGQMFGFSQPGPLAFTVTYDTGQPAVGAAGAVEQGAAVGGGLSVMNYSAATAAQQAITAALTQVASQRAQVGSLMDRLSQAGSDVQTSGQNLTSAQAGIKDANVPQAVGGVEAARLRMQVGLSMLSTAEQLPRQVLRLLP